jgi:hypothetical protein
VLAGLSPEVYAANNQQEGVIMADKQSPDHELPCDTSSLNQPEEVDGIFNAERFSNIPGDCKAAAEAIRSMGLPHEMIQNCPKLLEDFKAKGAPQTVTCIAELMLYAAATSD